MDSFLPGRRLVQVPGPTNVPNSVLQAIGSPTIDHRSKEFRDLATGLLRDIRLVFGTSGPVVMYSGSGTGAWEAALVNLFSPGDHVLITEVGYFASLWAKLATKLGLQVEAIPTDWRSAVDPSVIEERLVADRQHAIKAVLVMHNETSTGVLSDVGAVRQALDRSVHPALLLVDAVSSLASTEVRQDAWAADVVVTASQKGLMLPPGLSFNAVSEKALQVAGTARLPRSYWDWRPIIDANASGLFPYTPPTNLLFGLRAALDRLSEEGLDAVYSRHRRYGEVTRAAVRGWGLELHCADPKAYSPTVTAVRMPEGHAEDRFRQVVDERYGLALGGGLGKLAGSVFRIGHLGDFDDLSLVAALSGIELSFDAAAIPHTNGGVAAALDVLRVGKS